MCLPTILNSNSERVTKADEIKQAERRRRLFLKAIINVLPSLKCRDSPGRAYSKLVHFQCNNHDELVGEGVQAHLKYLPKYITTRCSWCYKHDLMHIKYVHASRLRTQASVPRLTFAIFPFRVFTDSTFLKNFPFLMLLIQFQYPMSTILHDISILLRCLQEKKLKENVSHWEHISQRTTTSNVDFYCSFLDHVGFSCGYQGYLKDRSNCHHHGRLALNSCNSDSLFSFSKCDSVFNKIYFCVMIQSFFILRCSGKLHIFWSKHLQTTKDKNCFKEWAHENTHVEQYCTVSQRQRAVLDDTNLLHLSMWHYGRTGQNLRISENDLQAKNICTWSLNESDVNKLQLSTQRANPFLHNHIFHEQTIVWVWK